jgi:hypothetical protein
MVSAVVLGAILFAGGVVAPLRAQSAAGQVPTAQPLEVPDWQTAAGGKQTFEVASVKLNKSSDIAAHANVTMDTGNQGPPSGGLFSATNFLLNVYVAFAYKITPKIKPSPYYPRCQSGPPRKNLTFRHERRAIQPKIRCA